MNKKIYEEYVKEHPEEMNDINRIKARSDRIRRSIQNRRRKRLADIEKYRRMLNGEYTE